MRTQGKIWDPVIRLFHWSVALAFLLNYFFFEEGGDSHELAGYYILCALGVRLVWGVIGSSNARFKNFFPTVANVKAHIALLRAGRIPEENGHNPVGALMIFALLFGLCLTGLSGWSLAELFHGEGWMKDIHEVAANLTFMLVLVHVGAVVLFSYTGPRNLIAQMVTGRISKR